jgi:hypothetical protein
MSAIEGPFRRKLVFVTPQGESISFSSVLNRDLLPEWGSYDLGGKYEVTSAFLSRWHLDADWLVRTIIDTMDFRFENPNHPNPLLNQYLVVHTICDHAGSGHVASHPRDAVRWHSRQSVKEFMDRVVEDCRKAATSCGDQNNELLDGITKNVEAIKSGIIWLLENPPDCGHRGILLPYFDSEKWKESEYKELFIKEAKRSISARKKLDKHLNQSNKEPLPEKLTRNLNIFLGYQVCGMTESAIGKAMGLSTARISQILHDIAGTLRMRLRKPSPGGRPEQPLPL